MSKRDISNVDLESGDTKLNRPGASSNDPQPMLKSIPNGILFLRLLNSRNRCFLPINKNYFGRIIVSKVLCDSACSTMLIPIDSIKQLQQIFEIYHCEDYRFSITRSAGVGG
jgi:hypothetical protein